MNIKYYGDRSAYNSDGDNIRLAVISFSDDEMTMADMVLSHFKCDGIEATMEDEIHIPVSGRDDYEYVANKYKEYKNIIKESFFGYREYVADKIIGAPGSVVSNTAKYMFYHQMGLSDAFKEAARECSNPSKRLHDAFMADDFREFIPSAYIDEYLDFEKYPLKYDKKC